MNVPGFYALTYCRTSWLLPDFASYEQSCYIYISMCMFLHEYRSLTSLSITALLLVPPLSCVGIFLTLFELHLSGTVFLCLFTDGLLWATTVLPSTLLLMVTWLFPTFRTELFRKGTGDRGKGLSGHLLLNGPIQT